MPLGAHKTALMGAAGAGGAFTAFGGIITQYTSGSTTYRVHTFRATGKLAVTSGSPDTDATY